jgi:hypothetical protein
MRQIGNIGCGSSIVSGTIQPNPALQALKNA